MIPRLYVIADMGVLAEREVELRRFSEELIEAGVELVQLRYKSGQPQEVLRAAAEVREAFAGRECRLILNDRADLAVLAGWDGVHVGQGDLPVADARRVVGAERWVGVSTHTDGQVVAADSLMFPKRDVGHLDFSHTGAMGPDYIAVGPVFGTGTKLDAAPVVGVEGVRRARAVTGKPLVAIGGITRENARSVIEAGADSVAVISGLFAVGETVEKVARDFLEILR